ncbi:MAG: arylesterase [Flavobacteriaceae bacterium]|nr:arylesterase [Bacteroidia bacterium]MBT8287641.1 arylesterase [Bacteroidia bacterium]NNF75544.1 arylesterase [Flavobacteriaceae bacterium]NNK73468.1 arylesterase [Flavobacteriaceae bacterium]
MLMIRYFFLAFILFSCDGDGSKKEQQDKQESIETEVVTETTTGTKTIVFFGDSLTAGYGLDDSSDAYPAIIQSKIVAAGLDYRVVNSGVSGETTAGGLGRIDWVLNQKVDVFVLELGGNDGLRGIALSETRENLQAIINAVRQKYPEATIILAGMQLPPNLGQDYTSEFKLIFEELAETNAIEFIPFLLKDVGGIPELNLGDGIHPNVEGQKIVADNVWAVLEKVLDR